MPIVEPDISLNGNYDLETAIHVNVKVQASLLSWTSINSRGLNVRGGGPCLRINCRHDPDVSNGPQMSGLLS